MVDFQIIVTAVFAGAATFDLSKCFVLSGAFDVLMCVLWFMCALRRMIAGAKA